MYGGLQEWSTALCLHRQRSCCRVLGLSGEFRVLRRSQRFATLCPGAHHEGPLVKDVKEALALAPWLRALAPPVVVLEVVSADALARRREPVDS